MKKEPIERFDTAGRPCIRLLISAFGLKFILRSRKDKRIDKHGELQGDAQTIHFLISRMGDDVAFLHDIGSIND